jgi:hypothetical protein
MQNQLTHRRSDASNLAASRTLGGNSENARSIPAFDSPDIRRSDSIGQLANHAAIAPPAQTSRRGFLMNTMVSAASLATAAAVVTPPLATTAALEAVSFPELLARFIPLHQRCMEMRAKEAAIHENIDRLASEMTGIEYGSFADLEVDDPSYNVVSIARRKVVDDMRSGDSAAEDRDLDELVEELEPVIKAIVNQPSKSLHDLGWQAEAITTLDQDLETIDDGDDDAERNLKTMLANIRRLAGPAAGRWDGADYQKSRAGKSTDPIFAAIEAHQEAAAAYSRCLVHRDELEEVLPADKRRSFARRDGIAKTDDPRFIEASEAVSGARDKMLDLAVALIDTPTTVAGVASLLKYVSETHVDDNDWMFPEYVSGGDDDEEGDLGEAYQLAVMRGASEAIQRMTWGAAA